jgi:hypothetical protein
VISMSKPSFVWVYYADNSAFNCDELVV